LEPRPGPYTYIRPLDGLHTTMKLHENGVVVMELSFTNIG